ncbi:ABC transporter permease [Montanilutibacter psychrotolerans]|uniref:ABC transporter permease n=1 Tax=Montanilutibacter psychrotolerans TaxID=1327343 RepID=A0A3M8SQT5_9GAMM|nr:ABC transporter permease [Lysobacter psychrotolerans]RNF83671.1 ABC transporter permease [Lysobacter psychrotolerans]
MKTSVFTTVWSVVRKELLDLSRDRRTLAIALLLGPLLYPTMLLGLGKLGESRERTQLDQVLEVPVVGMERAPNLVAFLATQGITATKAPADLDAAIARQDVDVALRIDEDYAADWHKGRPALVEVVQDSTRRNAEIPVTRLQLALHAYREQVGALRLMARGIDPAVTRAVNVGNRDLATEAAKRGRVLASLLPYLLILSSFLGGAALIIDATAGERERQSLEPLLATPVARGAIVSGKIAAACALGLLSLLLTLLAFKLSAQLAGDAAKMLDVSLLAIAKMLLILLPMLLIGTSLLTFLAAGSKSTKEAQSHMVWLMLLPMVPTIVLMVNPIKTELWQYTVPFLAQNQLLLKVIRAEAIDPQVWLVYLGCGFAMAAVLWYAATLRYQQEKLAIST